MPNVPLDLSLKERLTEAGIEVLWLPDVTQLPTDCAFEPPCSIKWLQPHHRFRLGAFSYAVSGYFFDVSIGRYCSLGEQQEFGRGGHPKTWLSTSPFQYVQQPPFAVGSGFPGADDYHAFLPAPSPVAPTAHTPIFVGNDVWVGHGAFVRPGVHVGDGSIVAARAVVTRDVAPYHIVAGNPARVVGQRFSDSVIGDLLDLKWWRFAPWQLGRPPYHDIEASVDYLKDRLRRQTEYTPAWVTVAELAR